MWTKNGRLIFKEEDLERDLNLLEEQLKNFIDNDIRFGGDIGVSIEYNNECWNETTNELWNEIFIVVTNFDKVIKIKNGDLRWATAIIGFTTDRYEPELSFVEGNPEFYYVFDLSQYGITNAFTWENNSDNTTIENIIIKEFLVI